MKGEDTMVEGPSKNDFPPSYAFPLFDFEMKGGNWNKIDQ